MSHSMTPDQDDPLRASLEPWIGKPMSSGGPAIAPDPVNIPMIRHWVDALDDHNPIYLDEARARASRFGGLVAPPAMLQTWTMGRPRLEGIAERGGSSSELDPDSPFVALAKAGLPGTLATNSELEFIRYLRPGDRLHATSALESISDRKTTGLGTGYFVTWMTRYFAGDPGGAAELVGRQRFRIFKFAPGKPAADPRAAAKERASTPPAASSTGASANATASSASSSAGMSAGTSASSSPASDSASSGGPALPSFALPVTTTRIVAGAIATRDFMPVHHDRDYARKQGAPDVFMNILTTNGYVARYVTDWAGSEAQLRSIKIRLGGPATPGTTLRFDGQVESEVTEGRERVLTVGLRAVNELGMHASGTVELSLPRRPNAAEGGMP
jgi:acyl dehydratase